MVDTVHQGDGQMEHPAVRYERTDASFWGIVIVILAALGFAAIVHYAILMYYRGYERQLSYTKKSPFPLAPSPSTALPREPRLEQIDRLAGIERPDVYQREWNKLEILNSYGNSSEEGYLHIPIDRAMDLLAKKLPHREAPTKEQQRRSSGLMDAGESNSGQMLRRGPR